MKMSRRVTELSIAIALILVAVYRENTIDYKLKMVTSSHAALVGRVEALAEMSKDFADEASRWKQQAEQMKKSSVTARSLGSRHVASGDARSLARDILDFESEESMAKPTQIISPVPEITKLSDDRMFRYERDTVLAFRQQFGGRLNGFVRRMRPFGLDTSRIQRHIALVNSDIAILFVPDDLNDLANQLDPPAKSHRSTMPPRVTPDLRTASAAGK